jgi:hypothetical protein
MDLLSSLTSEKASVYTLEDATVYLTNTDLIYAPNFSKVSDYPVEAVDKLINQEFKSLCTISRSAVLNILDRISLFVGSYDKKSISLVFTEEGVVFKNKRSSGTELVPYLDVHEFIPFACSINIEFLRNQIASQDMDNVDLYFGSPVAIKLVSGNITQIVALLNDTEEDNGEKSNIK